MRELKLIYDDLPDLHVIITSSSVLDIYKGESDLSRRAINYHLKELSFREYYQQLNNTINLILDIDLQSIENIEYAYLVKDNIENGVLNIIPLWSSACCIKVLNHYLFLQCGRVTQRKIVSSGEF